MMLNLPHLVFVNPSLREDIVSGRYWVSHWVSLGPRASCILKVREDI